MSWFCVHFFNIAPLQYADRISQSRDTGETRDFISSHTGQSKTEIHRELESYNKEREHL